VIENAAKTGERRKRRRPNRCGVCGTEGHNRQTCGRQARRVFIAWIKPVPAEWEGVVQVLDSYAGVRVYRRDHYDARCDLGRNVNPRVDPLPYFDVAGEALDYMLRHRGVAGMCQVDVCELKAMGLEHWPLSEES